MDANKQANTKQEEIPIRIEQIKIFMNLNIPSMIKQQVVLTSSMIYNPLSESNRIELSQYPYFTPDVLYPKTILNTFTMDKRVSFFFDKEVFESVLTNYSKKTKMCKSNNFDYSEVDNDDTTYDNLKIENCNIEMMIDMLFPTIFPSIGNNIGSFSRYIMQQDKNIVTFKGSIPKFISNIIPNISPSYSYIVLNGKTYTVTKSVWLNDFVNNPIYKAFIESYIVFEAWRNTITLSLAREKTSNENDITKILVEPAIDTIRNNEKVFVGVTDRNKLSPQAMYMQRNNVDYQINALTLEIRKLFGYGTDNIDGVDVNIIGFRAENLERENVYKLREENSKIELSEKNNDTDESKDELNVQSNLGSFSKTIHVDEVINSINEINSYISIVSASIPGFKLNGSLFIKIGKLTRFVEELTINRNLSDNYFSGVVNPGFDKDETIPNNFKNGKYLKYTTFVDDIKGLIAPSRESSNNELQKVIGDYVNNIYTNTLNNNTYSPKNNTGSPSHYFNSYIQYIKSKYYSNQPVIFPKSDEYFLSSRGDDPTMPLFVGISRIDFPEILYEMHIQLDVIGGEINDTNKHLLGCDYMGDLLGDKLQMTLTKKNAKSTDKYKVDAYRFYYDLQPNIDKFMNSPKPSTYYNSIKNRVFSPSKPIQSSSVATGGKSRRRYRRLTLKHKRTTKNKNKRANTVRHKYKR
jgi:hypothetical protein